MMKHAPFLLIAALSCPAQTTILQGVFTDAQAARGEAVYAAKCARCHDGADVDGPGLKGSNFIDRWREDSLAGLHDFISANMPQDEPGKLPGPQYLDLTAYLLKANSYAPGASELGEAGLSALIVGKDGPKPLPTNSMVRVAGCLAKDGSNFKLSNTPEPSRTRDGEKISMNDRKAAGTKPTGSLAFQLRNTEDVKADAAADAGAFVLIKGVLVRNAAGDRINVLAYEVISKTCP